MNSFYKETLFEKYINVYLVYIINYFIFVIYLHP